MIVDEKATWKTNTRVSQTKKKNRHKISQWIKNKIILYIALALFQSFILLIYFKKKKNSL